MTKINNFIFHSDFATLKNDDKNIITLALPNSISIPAGGTYTQSVPLTIGQQASQIRSLLSTTRDGLFYPVPAIQMAFDYGASMAGVTGTAYVSRQGNQVFLNVMIPNPYSSAVTLSGVAQTITAKIVTYLNPFS